MKSLVAGEMSFASLARRLEVGEEEASSNSTQPQPYAHPPDPQNSTAPPANAAQSPPPPSKPPMASPPLKLSPPPPQPTVSAPPPATTPPPPSIPPPPVTANSPPPPPVDPPNSPPPPSTNRPPPPPPATKSPPPPATKSPPPKPPAISPPPPPPPPATESPPPPKPPESPPPPPPRQSPPPPPRNSPPPPPILKSPPPPPARKSPSKHRPSIFPKGPHRTPSTDGSSDDTEITNTKFSRSETTVVLALVFGLLLLVIMVVACCLRRRKKASGRNGASSIMPTSSHEYDPAFLKRRMSNPKNGSGSSSLDILCSPGDPGGFTNSRSWFNYEELFQATDGFSDQNLLGEGGFGCVYKGILAGGREVAVKQLKIGGGQGDREFRSEVEIISRIHHRHLVTLVGYCIQESSRLLVYDYVLNNNLYFHLHGEDRPVLNWDARVKISLGAARGIAYLHEDCHPRIIHRDIKSSNILLDSNFEARVSDFGLAKLALDAKTHVSTRVVGTFGYMAPEYASSGKLTESSDVYSFGVVLLELITGRKPVDKSQSLVEWARPLLSQALEAQDIGSLADPRLESQYVESEMFRMIEAAAACVRHSFFKRPKMGQVVRALDIMANTDLTNGMRVGESNMFSPSTQSAEIRLFQRMAFGSQDDISTGFFDR